MTYVTDLGEYADLRGISIMELPEGLRATSHNGRVYEIIAGHWKHVGEGDPWVPDEDLSDCYRVDHDPLAIDCHGVDPAMIQDYLDGYIAHREAVAEAEALAEKARAAGDRTRDLFGRHCANREALRAALNAVAQAAA